jgi:hypothetical protein
MAHCDDCAIVQIGQVYREKRDLAYMDEATISMVKVSGDKNQRRIRIIDIMGNKLTILTLTDIHGEPVPDTGRYTQISRKTLERHYQFIAH